MFKSCHKTTALEIKTGKILQSTVVRTYCTQHRALWPVKTIDRLEIKAPFIFCWRSKTRHQLLNGSKNNQLLRERSDVLSHKRELVSFSFRSERHVRVSYNHNIVEA